MAKRKLRKKWGYFKCGICGKRIKYKPGYVKRNGIEPGRLVAVRKHWAKAHPSKWKKVVRKAVRKRVKRLKRK